MVVYKEIKVLILFQGMINSSDRWCDENVKTIGDTFGNYDQGDKRGERRTGISNW